MRPSSISFSYSCNILKGLEKPEKKIKKYHGNHVIKDLTKKCWNIFKSNAGNRLTEENRKFVTCISWLCFIALSKDKNLSADKLATEAQYQGWADTIWNFLGKVTKILGRKRPRFKITSIACFTSTLSMLISWFFTYARITSSLALPIVSTK